PIGPEGRPAFHRLAEGGEGKEAPCASSKSPFNKSTFSKCPHQLTPYQKVSCTPLGAGCKLLLQPFEKPPIKEAKTSCTRFARGPPGHISTPSLFTNDNPIINSTPHPSMPLSGNIPVPFFEAGVETIHTDRPVVAGSVYPSEPARQEVIKATNLKGCYVCSRCYRGGLDTQRLCDKCRGVGRTARANREAGNPPQGGTSIEYHRSRTVADFLGHGQTHGSPKRTSVQGHQMKVIGNASTVRRPVRGAACKLQFLLPEEIPAFLTETSSSPTLPQLRSGPTHRTTKASPTTLMSTTTLPLPSISAKRVLQGLSSFRNSLHLRISVKDTTIPAGHADIEVQHPSQPNSITSEKEDTCKGPRNKKTGIQSSCKATV
ncbi:uncharacterized protein B0T23DRAFT_313894, partial [Neurospora hispaniola]